MLYSQPLHLRLQSIFMGVYIMELTHQLMVTYAMGSLEQMPVEEASYFLGTGQGLLMESYNKFLESILYVSNVFSIF
jgi:hypothetical protein